MEEIWKEIPGYEGYYEASTFGRIRSIERIIINRYKVDHRKSKILKPQMVCSGYFQILLSKNGIHVHKLIHRLVAETFIPNPHKYNQVNHKDENKSNNHVNNLEWCNAKYNSNYGTGIERRKKPNKVSVCQYSRSGLLINTFSSLSDAERETGIVLANISSVCKGKRNTAGGYIWKYKNKKAAAYGK